MKIYFPDITFQGNPIIWDLNEETNQAICLWYCIRKERRLLIEQITPEIFTKFPGITINGTVVTIKDISMFNQAFVKFCESKEITSSSKPSFTRQHSTFFPLKKKSSDVIVPDGHSPKCGLTINSRPLYSHIVLDELIKNNHTDSTLWGDTVAYEHYFEEKTKKDAKDRKAIFLKTEISFHSIVQYEKNKRLYPLKSELIKEIRGLLEVFDPIYVTWYTQERAGLGKKSIYRYFQNAVLEAMLNGPLNSKATEFETSESEKLSPALKEYAIAKTRALRAEVMLMKFIVLIHPELTPELAVNEKESKTILAALTTLRKLMLQQPEDIIIKIKQRLHKITTLIIESGKVEESNIQLSDALIHDLDVKKPVIMDFHSFQSLIQSILEKQIRSRKELVPNIVSQVIKITISELIATFKGIQNQYIAPLSLIIDKDFYLCQEVAEKLVTELTDIHLKHPKEDKKIIAYSQVVASKVVNALTQQINQENHSTLDKGPVPTS